MRDEINIPPFYVGQSVVAVDAVPTSGFKNGTQYTISAVEYKFGNSLHPIGRITKYWYVGIAGFSDTIACYRPGIFAPIEFEYSVITFKEMIAIENVEVLLNN